MINNRDNDRTQEQECLYLPTTTVSANGAFHILLSSMIAYPCSIDSIHFFVSTGISLQFMNFDIFRIIPGIGSTLIPIGVSTEIFNALTEGVQQYDLGSTAVFLSPGDLITFTASGGSSINAGAVDIVLNKVQDIIKYF